MSAEKKKMTDEEYLTALEKFIDSGREFGEGYLQDFRLLSAIFPEKYLHLRWKYEDMHPTKPSNKKKGGADK